MRLFLFFWICTGLCFSGHAQLPTNQIYIFKLRANEEKVLLSEPKLLTAFNPTGYNNQPHFINPDEMLITSDYMSKGLTDILHLHLKSKKITRLTATEESEYSPTVMPDNIHFSVVRQELDDSHPVPQVLWTYPLDRSDIGSRVIPDLQNIGYHLWLNENKVALFLVNDPSQIVVYDRRAHTQTLVASDVGRCMKKGKYGELIYSVKGTDSYHLMSFDPYQGKSTLLGPLPKGQVDFDILPNGHFMAADETVLLSWDSMTGGVWRPILDTKSMGVTKITRIASTSGKVAVVTE